MISADSSFMRAGKKSCPRKPRPNSAANRRMNPPMPPPECRACCAAALSVRFEADSRCRSSFLRLSLTSPATMAPMLPPPKDSVLPSTARAVLADDRAADGRDIPLHERARVQDDVAAERVRVSLHMAVDVQVAAEGHRVLLHVALHRQVAAVDDGVVHRIALLHLQRLAAGHHVLGSPASALRLAHLLADPLLDLLGVEVILREQRHGGHGGHGRHRRQSGHGGHRCHRGSRWRRGRRRLDSLGRTGGSGSAAGVGAAALAVFSAAVRGRSVKMEPS